MTHAYNLPLFVVPLQNWLTSAKAKVDTAFEKLPENLKEGSLTSKETFRKFLDHKIWVIKKEHREEEALK